MSGIIADSLLEFMIANSQDSIIYENSVTYIDSGNYDSINECEYGYMTENINNEMNNCVIKFDTACSHNMSGVSGRIVIEEKINKNVYIKGFNGNISIVNELGKNDDGKKEYFVEDMPSDMVLLSANDYCKDGTAVLLPNSGVVLQMTDLEREKLQEYIKQFRIRKELIVKNRTYEVKNDIKDIAHVASMNYEEATGLTQLMYISILKYM